MKDAILRELKTRFGADPDVDRILICTPDKDMAKCVRGSRIVCFDRMRRRILDEPAVVTKFGVSPPSIPDWLALVGDSADGYPGIPGIGGFIFAFKVLPIIIFICSFFSLLYYFGIIQWVVKGMAWVMQKTMKVSGAEALCVAANVFIGQTEAPVLIDQEGGRVQRMGPPHWRKYPPGEAYLLMRWCPDCGARGTIQRENND